jgi:protein TonB
VPADDFAAGTSDDKTPGIVLPRVNQSVMPKYTSAAMKAKIQGVVPVQVVIGEDGLIEKARVIRSLHPDLDEEALLAARQWTFRPGALDGRPVRVSAILVLEFRLH